MKTKRIVVFGLLALFSLAITGCPDTSHLREKPDWSKHSSDDSEEDADNEK